MKPDVIEQLAAATCCVLFAAVLIIEWEALRHARHNGARTSVLRVAIGATVALVIGCYILACFPLRASAAVIPPADLARYMNACAPHVHPQTQAALVADESGGDPLAIGDNNSGHSYFPASYAQALAIANDLIAHDRAIHGRGIDVGIGQINSRNFPGLGVDAAAMLQPCPNLAVSSRMLHGAWRRTHSVDAALQTYNSGSPHGAPAYVARVRAAGNGTYVRLALGSTTTAPMPAPQRQNVTRRAFAFTSAHFYTEDAP